MLRICRSTLAQLGVRRRLLVRLLAPQAVIFLLVGRHELVDQFGLQQIVLEAPQHGLLQHIAPDRQPIVAGPPIAGVGAAVVPRADQRVAAAAGAAGEQPGEQVVGPARAFRPHGGLSSTSSAGAMRGQ